MMVRLGWSGDIHGLWTKMDVEVEESDIRDLLAEHDIDLDKVQFKPLQKFKLMYAMAEMFVQLHKMSRYPDVFGSDEDKADLDGFVKSQDKIVKQLKVQA